MQLETSTIMMFFFLALLVISVWKIYVFLPRERLSDDDTTSQSQEELTQLMLEVIYENEGLLDEKELFEAIKAKSSFDEKHYWRFNLNRLKQLLSRYYLQHPDTQSIMDIYKKST